MIILQHVKSTQTWLSGNLIDVVRNLIQLGHGLFIKLLKNTALIMSAANMTMTIDTQNYRQIISTNIFYLPFPRITLCYSLYVPLWFPYLTLFMHHPLLSVLGVSCSYCYSIWHRTISPPLLLSASSSHV